MGFYVQGDQYLSWWTCFDVDATLRSVAADDDPGETFISGDLIVLAAVRDDLACLVKVFRDDLVLCAAVLSARDAVLDLDLSSADLLGPLSRLRGAGDVCCAAETAAASVPARCFWSLLGRLESFILLSVFWRAAAAAAADSSV